MRHCRVPVQRRSLEYFSKTFYIKRSGPAVKYIMVYYFFLFFFRRALVLYYWLFPTFFMSLPSTVRNGIHYVHRTYSSFAPYFTRGIEYTPRIPWYDVLYVYIYYNNILYCTMLLCVRTRCTHIGGVDTSESIAVDLIYRDRWAEVLNKYGSQSWPGACSCGAPRARCMNDIIILHVYRERQGYITCI